MVGPIPNETWKSCVSSRHRQRVLLMISSLSEGYLGQIATLLNLRPYVVRWVLYGRPPYYAPELSLLTLGLVRERETVKGRAFEITPLGRRKARSIVAARNRMLREITEIPAAPRAAATPPTWSWTTSVGALDEPSSERSGPPR